MSPRWATIERADMGLLARITRAPQRRPDYWASNLRRVGRRATPLCGPIDTM